MRRVSPKKVVAGTTLVELVLTLSLVSVLLGGMVGLASIIRTSDQRSTTDRSNRQEIRRFADDVRREIHIADEIDVQSDGIVLSNTTQATKTTYRVVSGSVISRTVETDGDSVSARDVYTLGRELETKIESLEEDRLIRWTLTESDRLLRPVVIDASRKVER